MKLLSKIYIVVAVLLVSSITLAQEKDYNNLSKSEILKMSYEELIDLDFPVLLSLADIVGMSTDELLQLAIVSASREEESLMDAPLSVSVVTGDMIKRSGATSIPEALRLVPGVIVREQTPGVYDVHLRGMDTPDPNGLVNWTSNSLTLVMVNNRIIYNEYQGNISWELLQISIDDVEQIEVVKGPAAALYGTNAVTGAINILTKNPNKKDGLQASTYSMMGTPNLVNSGFSAGYNFDNPLSVRFSGHYENRKRHNVDYYMMGTQPIIQNGTVVGADRVGFVPELTPYNINIIGGPMVNADAPYIDNDPTKGYNYNHNERFPNPDQSLNKYSFNGHINFLQDDIDLNMMGGYSRADVMKVFAINNMTALSTDVEHNVYGQVFGTIKDVNVNIDYNQGAFESLGAGSALMGSYKIFASDAFYNLQITDDFNLKPGVSYRTSSYFGRILGSEGYDYDNFTTTPGKGDRTNSTMSAYIRADYHIGKSRIIGAVRADKFQYPNTTAVSPQLVYTFKATEKILLRASYGRAYRSPFMINLFTDLDMQYEGAFPDPAIQGISDMRENPQANGLPAAVPSMPGITPFYNVSYRGTEVGYKDVYGSDIDPDYDLMHVDEFEVGARVKVNDWVNFDGEVFYSIYKDLDVFSRVVLYTNPILVGNSVLDSTTLSNHFLGYLTNPTDTESPGNTTFETNTTTSFVSSDVTPKQMGTSLSMFGQVKKFDYNVFITLQQTTIEDYYMINETTGFVDETLGTTDTISHEATPSYYGGFNLNYRPVEKLNINMNGYYYGPQTLKISSGRESIEEDVEANLILNATVSYEFYDNMKFFISARNFATGARRQFAIADRIGESYMFGVDIGF